MEPTTTPTATPEPAPTPTPAPTATPVPVTATVTNAVVNLRFGPGIHYYQAGQMHIDDLLLVTGRNADASWLQVADPANSAARLWIFGSMTSLTAEAATVGVAEARVPKPPPVEATSCTRLHGINPNETRLSQITDWYGLDLADVAYFNGLDPETPLRTGAVICLAAPNNWQPPAPTVLDLLPTSAECARMLQGIDIQARGPNAEHLSAAVGKGNHELAGCLLDAGADPDVGVEHHLAPLIKAIVRGYVNTVLMLLEFGANPETTERGTQRTALFKAAEHNRVEVIAALLAAGANLQTGDKAGLTPLHAAVLMGQDEAVIVLLESGADMNARTRLGDMPLHLAARKGHWVSAIGLLASGADANARTHLGDTPSHLAARNGHLLVLAYLLDSEADPRVQNERGWTPLHELAAAGDESLLTLLSGEDVVDLNVRTPDGETALHLAARFGHRKFVKYLIWATGDADPTEAPTQVDALNNPDHRGNTPHHAAAKGGHLPVVECLLLWGADPRIRNAAGSTPAELAAANGYDPLAERLQFVADQPNR
ncbi:MAG: ankyrin repeat domain-containing protein [Caldilineaceae bacterium]|nr:ankyrin repeat domain-containing protein [Caldilineaceae bacterium]